MSLALGAVLLAILLIPPLIFVYFYNKGTYARGIPKLSLVEYLLISAILSVFIHGAVVHYLDLQIDFVFLVKFISGQLSKEDIAQYQDQYRPYFIGFAKYIFFLSLTMGILGNGLRWILTQRRLRMLRWLQALRDDRKPNNLVAYFNSWWYYFRFNEYSREYEHLGRTQPLVYVDILIDAKDTTILYSGILHDYVIQDGQLISIFLHTSSKRFFVQSNENKQFVFANSQEIPITPSGLFCIPYAKVLNMHIRFVAAEADASEEVSDELLEKIRVGLPQIEPPNAVMSAE